MGDLNGSSAGARKLAPSRSSALTASGKLSLAPSPAADPMSRVLSTGPRIPVAVTIAGAIFLHVGMAAGATAASLFDPFVTWHRGIRDVITYRLSQYEMDILKEPPPPPPEEPKPEPKTEPEPEPVKAAPVREKLPPQEAAPPKPAEAGKVLTADPTPNEGPVNLTNTIVTGSGSTFAGGTTSSDGTSKTAVYNPMARPTGVVGGTGTGTAPPPRKEDKSRAPGLLGSMDWNDCPFPGEADAEQIDQAFVTVQVKVKPDGSPENVTVVQDPGHGFGREARKCAMRKKYVQGLDPDGNAIGGITKPFRVRFER